MNLINHEVQMLIVFIRCAQLINTNSSAHGREKSDRGVGQSRMCAVRSSRRGCTRVTALSHQSHTAFTHSKPVRHNRRVGVRACGQLPRKRKQNQSNTNQIMKLTLKNLLQAKSCSFVAATIALATMAASNAAADNVRVFNKT